MQYVENPPNPWLTHSVEWIGEPPETKLEVFEETDTRSIISHNRQPGRKFRSFPELLSRLHSWLHLLFQSANS